MGATCVLPSVASLTGRSVYLKRPVHILTSKSVIFVNIARNRCMSPKIMKDCKVSFIHISNVIFFAYFGVIELDLSECAVNCSMLRWWWQTSLRQTLSNFRKTSKYSRPRNSNSISFRDSCLINDEGFWLIANLLTKLAMSSPLGTQDSKPNIADFVNSLDISQKPPGN